MKLGEMRGLVGLYRTEFDPPGAIGNLYLVVQRRKADRLAFRSSLFPALIRYWFSGSFHVARVSIDRLDDALRERGFRFCCVVCPGCVRVPIGRR